jgi:hypothetical protein
VAVVGVRARPNVQCGSDDTPKGVCTHGASPTVMRYGGNPSSMVRAACKSAVAKPSVNRS